MDTKIKELRERRYKYLLRGDLVKIAKALKVTHYKVKDNACGREQEAKIIMALEKLNEARRLQAEKLSDEAVNKIINQ